ncbi:cytochrome b [Aeromonas sp. sia0103]|uniref:cytochrome b n=1 Tax=Aeromonas sp. sia0103 TaxID=2854782 RepID=UPI000F928DEE|nr:cytochrome b [Aeromonas sp. sia0103]MBV7597702.1 cytochrome b [Aeromonas sp. sia0103]
MLKNTERRYGSLSIGLHWLTLLLMIAVYSLMEFRDIFPKGSVGRDAMKEWHFMLGLLILALVVVRLLVRFSSPSPRIEPALSPLMLRLAQLAHLALYGFLLLTPLLGWLLLSAGGKPIPFFGAELPALMAPDDGLKGTIKELHETLANIGYALIALHAAAALYHHHVLKDNTLTNMLPEKK